MDNQNLTSKQNQDLITSAHFQSLKYLSTPLSQAQCVLYKHEILICGGHKQRDCYSYNILKDEYKFICDYPSDVTLWGHCVVKLIDNNNKNDNEITLLSFGGKDKHTLMMKYVSVWSNDNGNKTKKSKKSNNYNQWIPFPDDRDYTIRIGRDGDNYCGVRAVVGGSNNNLLFITYLRNSISIFDLNTHLFIKHDTLPTNASITSHCLILKPANEEKDNIKKNKNYEIILFHQATGLSIKYNENKNMDIASLKQYAYVCINDVILFFGGLGSSDASKLVHKYSIKEKKWFTFEYTLPIPLYDCCGIWNENDAYIHIIGGNDDKGSVAVHMKTKMNEWMDFQQLSKDNVKLIIEYWTRTLKIKLGWINDFNNMIIRYVRFFQLLMVLQGHHSTVNSVRFSADGRKIVSASFDHTVRIWDTSSGKQIQIFRGHTNRVHAARFSPDGHTVVSCSDDGTIRLWKTNTGTEVKKFKKDSTKILDVNFSPDGKYIVAGLQDNTIQLWDVHSGIEMKQLLGHSNNVLSTQFSPDGKMIVSSSGDKMINLWNVKSGEMLKQFKGHSKAVIRAKFSPNGKYIVSCSLDNTIRIWNVEAGIEWKILKGHSKYVNDVKYFPDGQTIVSCSSDNTIRLWNVESEKRTQILEGHSHCVRCVDIFENGNIIASGSTDCKIRIWG
ncbi:WD repeat-containing protein [Reticulomyxa filosa]|uniref:WD repeat-containing protein n=1 Tax=Reticulomyxa filosa TaxID=46433 RepID=X6LVW8_RETFI|nr:WD repeat-containing protein [Reticulomyxa filosa]|eukprot:ETO05287.1 WD repeat-containing protein [Reticulomyxa filosa]